MLGSNPLIAPKLIPQVMEHVKQHMLNWYKEQMTQYVTAGTNIKLGNYEDSKLAPEIDKAFAVASDHVKIDSQQVFSGVTQALQQLGQLMQTFNQPPPPPVDPEAQAVLQASLAETQRRATADQAKLTLDQAKLQAENQRENQRIQTDVAMNADNNLTQERMKTAQLTVDQAKLQKEQEQTALKLNQTTQRRLGD
jgi:hypothetical protein